MQTMSSDSNVRDAHIYIYTIFSNKSYPGNVVQLGLCGGLCRRLCNSLVGCAGCVQFDSRYGREWLP